MICVKLISDYSCHLGRLYVGCIAYADEIILISASVCDLQKMLDVCYKVGSHLDIVLMLENVFFLQGSHASLNVRYLNFFLLNSRP